MFVKHGDVLKVKESLNLDLKSLYKIIKDKVSC